MLRGEAIPLRQTYPTPSRGRGPRQVGVGMGSEAHQPAQQAS